MIAVKIQSEPLTRLLAQADKLGHGDDAAMAAGRGVKSLLVNYFSMLDGERSQRSHFYGQTAKATSNPQPVGPGVVTIGIDKVGFAQRWLGGPIYAGRGVSSKTGKLTKYLAIPASGTEAEGKTPADFPNLQFFRTPRGGGLKLTRAIATLLDIKRSGKNKGKFKNVGSVIGDVVLFWLVDHVNQSADPSVMPPDDLMAQTATDGAQTYVSALLANN